MKKIKLFIIPISVFIILFAGYTIYGSTMINIDNEKSVKAALSADKDNPVTILALEKAESYAGILYTVPADADEDIIHFAYLQKHGLYSNRYKIKGGGKGNTPEADSAKAYDPDKDGKPVFFIYAAVGKSDLCSVFEYDSMTGKIIQKLDELEVPKKPYVISKGYELKDNFNNDIMVFDGAVSLKTASKYFQ